jgi:ribosomal protein S7
MYQRYNKKLKYVLNNTEYYEFLSKFRGSLIFRGKSSLSFKLLDKIFLFYKKKFGIETDYLFKRAITNLMPYIGFRNVRLGKKTHYVPLLLKKHRRFKLLNEWLLKSNKNKSNVRGLKINDVCKMFYDALFNKGPIFDLKAEHFKKAMSSRYLLRSLFKSKKGKYSVKKLFKSAKKNQVKYIYTNATIKKLLHSLLFLNFYRTKKIRKFNSILRRGLKYV